MAVPGQSAIPTAMNPPPVASPAQPSPRTLEFLDPSSKHVFQHPTKRINEGVDVTTFLTTKAYRDIGTFVLQLNLALCPRRRFASASETAGDGKPPKESVQTFPLTSVPTEENLPQPVRSLRKLLNDAEALIDLAPPDPGPRRFGNISFRKWSTLLEERCPALLDELLSPATLNVETAASSPSFKDEVTSYLLGSWGSPQRLDYGTGHELSFLAFLACLWKLGFFSPSSDQQPAQPPAPASAKGETERLLILAVMEPYLRVARKLILTYTLEPAGSHGVWGLDDHSFLPYIFGSAQLTRAIAEGEAMPQEGSVRGAPRTGDIVKPEAVGDWRGANMYFSAVGFINDVKTGPFWEHSPILFDVSGVRDGWGKINKGMIKMFNAEVLSKFPVVQHFPFGSLLSWDQDPDAAPPAQSIHITHQPPSANLPSPQGTATMPQPPGIGGAGTQAPWAASARIPPSPPSTGAPAGGIPYSRAPWAGAAGAAARIVPRPTPSPGSDAAAGVAPGAAGGSGSTDAQITMTKAPWAK